jgi:hypothetical protein
LLRTPEHACALRERQRGDIATVTQERSYVDAYVRDQYGARATLV